LWQCGGKGTLLHCWWQCKLAQMLWKALQISLKTTKNRTSIWSSDTTPVNIPERKYSRYDGDTCTHMFIAVLFTIGKLWKQQDTAQLINRLRKMWWSFIQP
jgi:hypothetical protein